MSQAAPHLQGPVRARQHQRVPTSRPRPRPVEDGATARLLSHTPSSAVIPDHRTPITYMPMVVVLVGAKLLRQGIGNHAAQSEAKEPCRAGVKSAGERITKNAACGHYGDFIQHDRIATSLSPAASPVANTDLSNLAPRGPTTAA